MLLGNLTGCEGTTGATGAAAGRALGSFTGVWLRGASFRRAGWKADTLGRPGLANTMGSSGLAAGLKASLELSTSTTLTSGSDSLTGLGVALLPWAKKVKPDLVVEGRGASVVVTATGRKVVTTGSATVVAGALVGLLPRMAESLGRNLFSLLGSLLMPRKLSLVSLSEVCSISLISSSWIWSLGLNLLAPFLFLNSLNLGARVVVVVVAVSVVVLTVGASVNTEKVCRVGKKAGERVVTSSETRVVIKKRSLHIELG